VIQGLVLVLPRSIVLGIDDALVGVFDVLRSELPEIARPHDAGLERELDALGIDRLDTLHEIGRDPAQLPAFKAVDDERSQARILQIDLHATNHPAGIQYLQVPFGTDAEDAALLGAGEPRQRDG
jgi:hypothetical protein